MVIITWFFSYFHENYFQVDNKLQSIEADFLAFLKQDKSKNNSKYALRNIAIEVLLE